MSFHRKDAVLHPDAQTELCLGVPDVNTQQQAVCTHLQVTRDRLMDQYHEQWPEYNFAQHKGYGTAAHMAVLKQLGACPIHRRTFAPLKHWIEAGEVAFVDIAKTDA